VVIDEQTDSSTLNIDCPSQAAGSSVTLEVEVREIYNFKCPALLMHDGGELRLGLRRP
jgi:hypothetical protein